VANIAAPGAGCACRLDLLVFGSSSAASFADHLVNELLTQQMPGWPEEMAARLAPTITQSRRL
jgi:hypothetical protein